MGCPAYGSFSPLTLILDHPPSCLALLLLHGTWEPFCRGLSHAPGCLQIPFIARSDMAGPAHWLLAE